MAIINFVKNRASSAHWLFLVIASVFGLAFVLVVPPLWGLDEGAHFSRVYQLSRGELIPEKDSVQNFGGKMPVNFNEFNLYTISIIGNAHDPTLLTQTGIGDGDKYMNYLRQGFSEEQTRAINPASYSPVAYPLSIVGVFFARILDLNIGITLLVSRLASIVTYITIVTLSIWIVRSYRIKWLFFAVALFPVSIFQASVLSADTLINALSLLFVAMLYCLIKERNYDSRFKIPILVMATLMPLVKINYIFLSLGVLLIPSRVYGKNKYISVCFKLSSLFLASVAALVWSKLSSVTRDAPETPRPDGKIVSIHDQLGFLVSHPFDFAIAICRSVINGSDNYLREMITTLGFNYVQIPVVVTISLIIIVILAALYAKDEFYKYKKELLILNSFLFLGAVSIFATLYLAFTDVGSSVVDGVQGRYLLPFLVPLVMLAVCYIPTGITIKKAQMPVVLSIVCSLCLVVSLTYYALVTY